MFNCWRFGGWSSLNRGGGQGPGALLGQKRGVGRFATFRETLVDLSHRARGVAWWRCGGGCGVVGGAVVC